MMKFREGMRSNNKHTQDEVQATPSCGTCSMKLHDDWFAGVKCPGILAVAFVALAEKAAVGKHLATRLHL